MATTKTSGDASKKSASIIKKRFDPKVATLREVMEMYADQVQFKGQGKTAFTAPITRDFLDGRTNQVRNLVKEYLDKPVIEIFIDGMDEQTNPLIAMWEQAEEKGADAGGSARNKLYISLNNIQDNVAHYMKIIHPQEEFTTIVDTVVKPSLAGEGAYGKRYAFVPDKMGEFKVKVALAAAQNPSKEGVARLALFLADTGFRPSMGRTAPFKSYIEPKKTFAKGSGMPGIYLDPSVEGVKMGSEVNVPISTTNNANIQAMMNLSLNNKDNSLTNLFTNTDGSKITSIQLGNFIKSIKVDGIMEDKENLIDGQPTPINNLKAGSAELRRMNATAYEAIGESEEIGGAVKGRKTKTTTTLESGYRSRGKGVYDVKTAPAIQNLDYYFWQQTTDELQKLGYLNSGQGLNPNTDLITAVKQSLEDKKISNPDYLVNINTTSEGLFQIVDDAGNPTTDFMNKGRVDKFVFPSQIDQSIFEERNIIETDPAELTAKKLTEVNTDVNKSSDELMELMKKIGSWKPAAKAVVGAVGAKTIASLVGGATTAVPLAAEAAVDVAFSSTDAGEEAIDPRTGSTYMKPERPPSDFMTEDEIQNRARMAKGQFEPDVFQRQLLKSDAQRSFTQASKGESVRKGSDNPNFNNFLTQPN